MSPERFLHYKTDLEFLDKDHWDLCLLMDLINSKISKFGIEAIETYNSIVNFKCKLIQHFDSEEQCMNEHRFPYINTHLEEHKKLNTTLEKMFLCFDVNHDHKFVISTMEQAILTHIDNYDLQFAQFYKNKLKV